MGWTLALSALWRIIRGVSGSAVRDTADRIADLLVDLKDAETEQRRAEIEREIAQLKMIHDIQKPQSGRWWSPMQIGQYLIVIPFGLWWAAVFVVSMLNENTGWNLVVQNVPPHLFEMAQWLIPVIVAGTLIEGRRK